MIWHFRGISWGPILFLVDLLKSLIDLGGFALLRIWQPSLCDSNHNSRFTWQGTRELYSSILFLQGKTMSAQVEYFAGQDPCKYTIPHDMFFMMKQLPLPQRQFPPQIGFFNFLH